MDDVPRQEINIVVIQADPGVGNAVPSQLVQFRIFDPCDALTHKLRTKMTVLNHGLPEILVAHADQAATFH